MIFKFLWLILTAFMLNVNRFGYLRARLDENCINTIRKANDTSIKLRHVSNAPNHSHSHNHTWPRAQTLTQTPPPTQPPTQSLVPLFFFIRGRRVGRSPKNVQFCILFMIVLVLLFLPCLAIVDLLITVDFMAVVDNNYKH